MKAKDRRSREKKEDQLRGAKPLTWYATPRDRHLVDEIAIGEDRPATYILSLAVRAFSKLYNDDPASAMAMARTQTEASPALAHAK